MTDAEALDKARKLKALAEGGATEGERTAARNVLGKFLARYPAIGPMLDAPAAAPPPPPPPSNVDGAFGGFPTWRTPPPRPGGGFRPSGMAEPPKPAAAGGFMGSVWDFLQGAAQSLREGMTLRERVKDVTTVDVTANTRTFTMRVTIPIRDLEELLDDAGVERDEEVATILASIVRQEFLGVLASMDPDDLDE